MSLVEKCCNPFLKKKCNSTEVILYITADHLPICKSCWSEIADKDYVWDEYGLADRELSKMKITFSDGTEMDVYYGLEGRTSDVYIFWVKKLGNYGIQYLKAKK